MVVAADLAAAVDGDGDGGGGVLTSDGVASEGKTTQSDSGGGKDTHHGRFADPACRPPRRPTSAAPRSCLPPRPSSSSSPPLAPLLVLALQRVACVLLAMRLRGWLPKTSRTHASGLRKRIGYSASRETTWEDPFGNDPNDPFACARAMECQRALWVSYPIIGFGCACAIVIFLSRSVFTESAKCMPRAQTQAFEITR